MRILFDSYNTVMQNSGGGVQMRIGKMYNYLRGIDSIEKVKLYDKWSDKLCDYDILHIFKDNIDDVNLISYAKSSGLKIVVSSVIPQMDVAKIKLGLFLQKIVKINNTFSLLRLGLQLSDAIVAQTIQEADFISKIYNIKKEKIHIIPNGVKESILDQYDPTKKKDIVLCVGRFDHNKNQLSLIKAIKDLGLPLHFVGGPSVEEKHYYNECKNLATGDNNIVFHGWLQNESKELLNLYQRAKVVVLISHKEIFGNSLIEGAASGANLVASNSIPTSEWEFNEHCVRVSPDSVQDIRKGIENAFYMPLSSFNHYKVINLFSWPKIAERYYNLYNNLMNQ